MRDVVKNRLITLGGSYSDWAPRWKDNKLMIGTGPGGKKGRVYQVALSAEGHRLAALAPRV